MGGLSMRMRDERGATIVIVALVTVVLFAMIVLVIDVGGLLVRRRAMVNASDAAALAAAKSCADATDTSLPESQADLFAADNVVGLSVDSGGIIELVNCDNGIGHVTVEYTTPQNLIFAQVLGFADTSNVATQATAAWGPLSSGNTVPIVVEAGTLQGPCQIPDSPDDPAPPGPCPLYYNNGDDDLGDADWGYMNLDLWGVEAGYNCSNAGAADRRDWIMNDYQDELLELQGDPAGSVPTYVCVDTGANSANWQDLIDRMNVNDELLFPVNDCTQQINVSGSGCDGTPDKYAVVGFVRLRVTGVYQGNDPAAIGTPGASGACGPGGNGANFEPYDANGDIVPLDTIDLNAFGAFGGNCGFTSPPGSITNVEVHPRGPGVTDFVQCPSGSTSGCDWSYDPATRTVTWWGNPTSAGGPQEQRDDLVISFNWANAGTPGACGIRPSDPNAVCLVTEWIDFTTSPGNFSDEAGSFGVFGFVLCDRELATCPDQD
jgi:hypothetical protein